MLSKSQRLTTEDFKNLRRARAVNAPHFILRLFPAASGQGKAAVVVPSSACKKAIDRNLLRRRMYHIIGAHASVLQGETLTITVKKGTHDVPFKTLQEEFLLALKQIH